MLIFDYQHMYVDKITQIMYFTLASNFFLLIPQVLIVLSTCIKCIPLRRAVQGGKGAGRCVDGGGGGGGGGQPVQQEPSISV